ncbi:MAG: LuxR family transcriptional regulator [Conexibacter sp.]|nr:LuxR family transcriptional regulator [Conexibacter sp.]
MPMVGGVSSPGSSDGRLLRGREMERARLDDLLDGARSQRSGVLLLRGEAGVGKTALLEHAIAAAFDLRVVRVVGVESEMELAFAALHQLCTPLLDLVPRLPDAQRDALHTAFGLAAGTAPDRFLVGLAVLSLLSEAAEQQPLLCVIDDAQWLDRESAQAVAFVARRMLAEPVVLLLATREPSKLLTGLPELVLDGLAPADARALLAAAIPGRLDEQIANQLIAETRGNPLALLELPRVLSPGQLAGGLGLQHAVPTRVEDSYRARLETLPDTTQRLLLLAAAEPTGDPALLWRAAEATDIAVDALEPAETAGLIEITGRVMFRHPLVRSVLYRSATPHQRRDVHRALAQATDPHADPDRHAWHLAQATAHPDEDVAAELERAATRAQARGGLAAAATYLERAAALTPGRDQRAQRALAAAQTKFQAGALDDALVLLDLADAGSPREGERARVDLLRGQIAFASQRVGDAPPLLLKAARELQRLDPELARDTYLDTLTAAMTAGRLAGRAYVVEASRAALAGPVLSEAPRPSGLLLRGLAVRFAQGYAAGAPLLKDALQGFQRETVLPPQDARWLWFASWIALILWDDAAWSVLSVRHLEFVRTTGALTGLPFALNNRSSVIAFSGDLDGAASLNEEARAAAEAIGVTTHGSGALSLAAVRGRETEFLRLNESYVEDARARGDGLALSVSEFLTGVLYNGLGHYDAALAATLPAARFSEDGSAMWALTELVEAAVHLGRPEVVGDALERIAETTQAAGTDWGLGIEARTRALLGDRSNADALYREAIERLRRSTIRVQLGRTHLLYGEWLRRERRIVDARVQLRAAHEMFITMGVEGFAVRAEGELVATGELRAPRHSVERRDQLTAQEVQVARLARDGLSNREIGARLFISPHTVAYHLHKVFAKLDIASRHQLAKALPAEVQAAG